MIRRRSSFTLRKAAFFFLASTLFLSGCSLPRIIILHDALSAEDHDRLGNIYERQGTPELAREQYRMALQQDRKHLPSLLLLGDLSFRLKDYREAEDAYTKALTLDPKNGDACNNLAWVYLQTGKKLDRAKELVDQALAFNPAHRSYYLDTLGVLLLKTGDTAGAIAALREAVGTIPKERSELLAEAEGHLSEALKAAGNGNQ